MADPDLETRFPGLFVPVHWGLVEASFEPYSNLPPPHLISNINLIPFVGDLAVVLRLADGRPELPGGTLEPDEDPLDALRRELAEEAGAQLMSFALLGAWRCHSKASIPYRSHLPHPDFYRVVGYGDVVIDQPPANPSGGEQVVAVELIAASAAASLFSAWQRPDLAALYMLAEARHREGPRN